MNFTYEAIAGDGSLVQDRIEAESTHLAADALRNRGLTVMRLAAAVEADGAVGRVSSWGGVTSRDLLVMTRQMKMLLESGATVVQALEAIERQSAKGAVARMIGQVRAHVEKGGSLSDALSKHGSVFSPIYLSLIAAAEVTATLPLAFSRLSEMAERQQRVNKTIVGAMLYPAILTAMCLSAVVVLITFVVPRFRDLFLNLRSPLPASTKFMFAISEIIIGYWPVMLLSIGIVTAATAFAARKPAFRQWLDERFLALPFFGRLRNRLHVARLLRMWAAMLNSHVPLMETIKLSQTTVRSASMRDMMQRVENAIAGGGRVGRTLAQTKIVEPVVASAIATGEENGRLAEAVEFVSTWMDEDNAQLVTAATRVIEPTLLALMGLIVGSVAMSLFIPLFDLATAGAH